MRKQRNIKRGQILRCDDVKGAITYQLLITKITKRTVKGRLDYSSSFYGSAAVYDHLERGKPITLKWKDLVSCRVKNDPATAAKIMQAAITRKQIAQHFIGDRNPVQSITMIYDNNTGVVNVEIVSTLPHKDSEGVPEACISRYSMNNRTALNSMKDDIQHSLSTRFNYVSSGGTFIPQTQVIFKSEQSCQCFKLEDGNRIVFPREMSKDLASAVNFFLDTARSQYGCESDWVARVLGPKAI